VHAGVVAGRRDAVVDQTRRQALYVRIASGLQERIIYGQPRLLADRCRASGWPGTRRCGPDWQYDGALEQGHRTLLKLAQTDARPDNARFPGRWLATAAVMTVTMFAWLGWHVYNSFAWRRE
jgi:hypothetical protein